MMGTQTTFEVSTSIRRGVPVVSVRGEIDVATAPRLRDELASTPGLGVDLCVVDLSAVTFLDSTALGVLVSAAQMCQEAGGELRLVVTAPHIYKVFTITGLDGVFAIHADIDQALLRA